MRVSLALAFAALTLPAEAVAQPAEAEVVVVIRRLFDAMRSGDSAAVRAVMHPTARLLTAGPDREGTPGVGEVALDRFAASIGSTTRHLDERIWDPEVRVDGDLATVWTRYAFYVDGAFSHCGVDAFQLARTPNGWRIIHIADTQRREGCPETPAHAR